MCSHKLSQVVSNTLDIYELNKTISVLSEPHKAMIKADLIKFLFQNKIKNNCCGYERQTLSQSKFIFQKNHRNVCCRHRKDLFWGCGYPKASEMFWWFFIILKIKFTRDCWAQQSHFKVGKWKHLTPHWTPTWICFTFNILLLSRCLISYSLNSGEARKHESFTAAACIHTCGYSDMSCYIKHSTCSF